MTHDILTRAAALADELTLDQQIDLMTGADWWNLVSFQSPAIGALGVTDGPSGARGAGGVMGGTKTAAFPVGIAIGASWSPALAERLGAALADEALDKGAAVLLGPTINLHRGPLNGRNFECLSEDPILTATLATGIVKGLQSKGVGATLKHFIANESEIRRTTNSSDVDERTLRELYMIPFERAVKDADAWAVMSSYNRVNGTYVADSHWALTQVLREDWGFTGTTMSDWFGLRSTAAGATSGLDLEMPGPTRWRGDKLRAAVAEGTVDPAHIRAAAENILRLILRTGAIDNTAERVERAHERLETRALIRAAGAESAVLLQNNGALPLPENVKIALIGPNAKVARVMGGGSAQVNAHRRVSIWDGMADAIGEDQLTFAQGCSNHRFEPVLKGEFTRTWFDSEDLSGNPVFTDSDDKIACFLEYMPVGIDKLHHSIRISGTFTPDVSGDYRFGMHCTGRGRLLVNGTVVAEAWNSWTRGSTLFEEGCDPIVAALPLTAGTPVEVTFEFATKPTFDLHFHAYHVGVGPVLAEDALRAAADVAANADIAILCLGRSEEWDTEGWDLPDMTLPGGQDALVAAVAGRAKKTIVVLQTGGPVEMPWRDSVDAIVQAWYPGQEAGFAITDVLTGTAYPSGRLPQSFPVTLRDTPTAGANDPAIYPGVDGHVRYGEGLLIGYRYHEAHALAPAFPFGFGLGYTQFRIGTPLHDICPDGTGTVQVQVENTGARAGAEVVQLYIAPLDAPVSRPPSELKGFAKLHLAAGAVEAAKIALTPRDFAYFDTDRQLWHVAAGDYEVRIGTSAADILHRFTVTLDAQDITLRA
ncbi:beta-glucosidase [Ketogulonicigenium robustum]|uniref:Beta-D-glucoside glucohydrolase n=1 Tax=Ketogulonicigenium robustum TaxID=92947 RepID=A0A1W6NZ12_9RHOB|nr:glycoside hydrolase family 3 C-terminal domain-containing protein [Ketogulonicigenium robustum]ARO14496.1 beta-glucosidase [Ketogulonicigenium robustum]